MDLHISGKQQQQQCYTVPECSIDDENCDSSSTNSDCDGMTLPANLLLPTTIGAFHTNDGRPPQLGYFVPLSTYYSKPQPEWNVM